MCLNHDLYFFWVSSLAYPNLLGKKCYVVVVVVVTSNLNKVPWATNPLLSYSYI